MQKYDKIYIPCEENERDCSFFSTEDDRHPMKEAENVIVLTVEELEKVWNAGWRAKVLENHPTAINKDFKTYLQSKGINIEC